MVSILKEWVLVIDIPKKIYELQKQGYDHFEAEFKSDSRRLEFKAWKKPILKRAFPCDHCTKIFLNPQALALHKKYQEAYEE